MSFDDGDTNRRLVCCGTTCEYIEYKNFDHHGSDRMFQDVGGDMIEVAHGQETHQYLGKKSLVI